MKPHEVLDMSLDMVQAVIRGYSDSLLDQQIIAVQAGYWSAYYSGSKHPKPVNAVAEEMVRKHHTQGATKMSVPRPDVDVEAFLEQKARFNSKLEAQGR